MNNSKSEEKKFNINANKFCFTANHRASRKRVKRARHSAVRQIIKNKIKEGRWSEIWQRKTIRKKKFIFGVGYLTLVLKTSLMVGGNSANNKGSIYYKHL